MMASFAFHSSALATARRCSIRLRFLGELLLFLIALFSASPLRAQGDDTSGNPTGNAGGFNGAVTTAGAYDPFTGNATRSVTDLVVPGTAGAYPLAFSRTANSRFSAAVPDDAYLGDGGGWRHSYQWAIADAGTITDDNNVTYRRWAVAYPDGRVTTFRRGRPHAPNGETFLRGPAGTSDRLESPAGEGTVPTSFTLHLSDGGRVFFYSVGSGGRYRATQIIDPFNQTTFLQYLDGANPYLLDRVTEPAGHYLKFSYDTYYAGGLPYVVLGKVRGYVKGGDGPNGIVSDVGLGYSLYGANAQNNPYLVLSHVYYYSEASTATPGAPVTARYHYGPYNAAAGKPLLEACDDPHYAGPMTRIFYAYNGNAGWGYLESESRAVNGNSFAETVSRLHGPGGHPIEYRGDGPSRNLRYGEQTTVGFTETHAKTYQLTSDTDFQGQWTFYAYNPKFAPDSTTQPHPHGPGYRNAVKDRRGHVTTFDTEPFIGQTKMIRYPGGGTRSFGYDYDNPNSPRPYHLHRVTDERGRSTFFHRDGNNLVHRIEYPDQSNEFFAYETVPGYLGAPFHRLILHTSRRGARTTYAYADPNRPALPTSVRRPRDYDNNVTFPTNFGYDSADRLVTSQDERGLTTWFAYDGRHQLTRLTHADGKFISYGFDDYGNATSVTNERGKTWWTRYDDYRRPDEQRDPLNRTHRFDYNLYQRPGTAYQHTTANAGTTTLPSQRRQSQIYTANWWVAQSIAAPGTADQLVTTYGHDQEGRTTSATDPRNFTQSWTFDARGRPATATDALGHATTRGYYPPGHGHAGLPEHVTTPGRFPGETLRTEFLDYDALGQIKLTRDPANQTVTREYDYAGALRFLRDANGINTFGYDLRGRLTFLSYPDGTYEGYHRDPAGNVDGYKNRANHQRTTWYDARNRPDFAQWANGTGSDVDWIYDDAGRLTDHHNWFSALHYEYDDADQLRSERATISGAPTPRTTAFRTNADGIVDQLTYPCGATPAWALNERNQSYGLYGLSYYGFWANGWSNERRLANGTITFRDFDAAGRIRSTHTKRHLVNPEQNISFRTYGYAPNGQMTWFHRSFQGGAWPENNTGDAYSYREDGALLHAWQDAPDLHNPAYNQGDTAPWGTPATTAARPSSYNYDNAGNRNNATRGGVNEAYVIDGENRVWAVGGDPVTWDGNSHLATLRGWNYAFDADGHLRSATGPAGQHQEFIYDAVGRLVRRIEHNVGTFYLYYAGSQLVEERDYAGNHLYHYFHDLPGSDQLLCRQDTAGNRLWYSYDARGQVSHLTDGAGNVVERYLYDVFGTPRVLDAAGNARPAGSAYNIRHLFCAGYEWLQGVGLFHCGYRFYRPDLGRWLSPDPAGFAASGTNLYAYCGNDPVNQIDPSGLGFVPFGTENGGAGGGSAFGSNPANIPTIAGGQGWQTVGRGPTGAMAQFNRDNWAGAGTALGTLGGMLPAGSTYTDTETGLRAEVFAGGNVQVNFTTMTGSGKTAVVGFWGAGPGGAGWANFQVRDIANKTGGEAFGRSDSQLSAAMTYVKGTGAEKAIVFGYSLGAWAALKFGGQLGASSIAVPLAITVDAVKFTGFSTAEVPSHIKLVINYYQQQSEVPTSLGSMRGTKLPNTHNNVVNHPLEGDHIAIIYNANPIVQGLIKTFKER